MARDGAVFVCQGCGGAHSKWSGRCDACGAWNTIVEESAAAPPGALAPSRSGRSRGLVFQSLDSHCVEPPRLTTGLAEFDRVCGGGVVPGSAILLAGDPGVGKSTLLLQVCVNAAAQGARVAYVSGEEAVDQIRSRARRMGLTDAGVSLAAETALRDILEAVRKEPFDLLVVDSIQTLWSDALDSSPGSVTQVRACASELVRHAKKKNMSVILVGHVTKDG